MHPKLQQLAASINAAHLANEQGDFKQAEQLCKKALKIDKTIPEAWYNLGIALRGLDHKKEAIRAQREAMKLTRDSADAQNSIGLELLELGEHKDAETALRRALRIGPNHAFAYSNLGKLFTAQKKHTEALAASERAHQLSPDHPGIMVNLGASFNAIKQHQKAEAILKKAISFDNTSAEAFNNLANALAGQNKHQLAIEAAQNSLKINENKTEPRIVLANSLDALDKKEEAIKVLETAYKLDHLDPEINNNLGHLLLGQACFSEGWPHYEFRFKTTEAVVIAPLKNAPRWDGALREELRLLVIAEQGIGDEILYAHFLQQLNEAATAKPISVTADARLIPIYERSFPKLRFLDRKQPIEEDHFNAQIPLASLGQFFLKEKIDFSKTQHPYLQLDPAHPTLLLEKFQNKEKLVCGLSWSSKNKAIGQPKSLDLDQLAPILTLPNLQFVNLQYGDVREQIEEIERKLDIEILQIDEIDNTNDIDGLLSLISACDFVVTTSNVTTHLAGAINKETYQLSPKGNGKFWYWKNQDEQGHSLWYPSVKILEQEEIGDWSAPIAKLKTILENR
jgi:tetratricopeptide (TPR) repeat protein